MFGNQSALMPESILGFQPAQEPSNVACRSDGTTFEPPPSTGPNGGPVGYNSSGDKVEYVIETDDDDLPFICENVLRRNDRTIVDAYNDLRLHVSRLHKARYFSAHGISQVPAVSASDQASPRAASSTGIPDSELGYGMLVGRLEALAWVFGREWEEAGDT